MTDYVFSGKPGNVHHALDEYSQENPECKLTLEHVQYKHILIKVPAEDDDEHETVVKAKFYEQGEELLVSFTRKQGNIAKWYALLEKMKATSLDFLRSPNVQNIEVEA